MTNPAKLSLPIFQNHRPESLIIKITGSVGDEDQLPSRMFKLGESVTLLVEGYVSKTDFSYSRDNEEVGQVITIRAEVIQDAAERGAAIMEDVVEARATDVTPMEHKEIPARAAFEDAEIVDAVEARLAEVESSADPDTL